MSPNPIAAEFRDVAFSFSEGGQTFDLQLRSGELAHVRLPGRGVRLPWAEIAHGTAPPRSGQVLFEGKDWRTLGIRQTESARKRIGRVFDPTSSRACWVQNLDVAENVLLSQSICPKHGRLRANNRAQDLAAHFGMPFLPLTRPSATSPNDLALAQWIRALLPDPLRLLILELPTIHAPDAALPPFLEALRAARDKGTAVLWIGGPNSTADVKNLSPDHSFVQTTQGLIESA